MPVNRSKIQRQADKYVAAGKIEAAIAQYRILAEDNPRDLGTLNKIGDLYVRINKKTEAIKNFTKIAEIYAEDGFFLKAIAIYKKITKIDPTRLETLERLAALYSKQGLNTEARAQYLALVQVHLKAGEAEQAIRVYKALVEVEPQNVQHRLALAELMGKYGKPEEAATIFLELGQELDRQGNAKESARIYEMALKTSRGDPAIAERLAAALGAAGQNEKASVIAEQVLEQHPDSAAMLEVRAQGMEAAGRRDEAEETARRALQIDSNRPGAVLCLARILTARGALAEAVEAISSSMDLLMGSEHGPEAVRALEEILTRDPGHRSALEDLYRLQTTTGNKAGTLFAGEKLVEICVSERRFSEALAVANRLAELEPEVTAHRERVARIEAMAEGKEEPPPAEATGEEEQIEIEPEEEISDLAGEAEEPEAAGAPSEPALAPEEISEPEEFFEGAEIPETGAAEPPELSMEEEEFIAERLTEAEVFVKYGLADRAIEQLAAVAERFPWHVDARRRLRDLYLEEGDRARATVEAAALGRIHLNQGDRDQAAAALNEARSIDASCPAIAELEALLGVASEIAVAAPAVPPAVEPEAGVLAGGVLIEEGEAEEELVEEEAPLEEPAPEPVAAGEPPVEAPALAASEEAAAGEEIFEPAGELAPEVVAGEAIGEPPEFTGGVGSAPEAGSDDFDLAAEIDACLFSAQEADEGEAALAALEASPEGHSLDEIVSAFKKGIEKQVDAEDFETHYNLGIAYKEMGLTEEAIGEFQFAAKDPGLLPSCCSMLGLCFKEKGMLSLAVKWYRKGLDALASGGDDELMNGIRYDLAEAFEAMGEYREARDLLVEIYGINSRYRDVAARIKAIEERLQG